MSTSLTRRTDRPGAEGARTALRLLLGAFLATAGVLHLTVMRQEFHAQVPSWFPIDDDVTVIVSGVVEVALGLALLLAPQAYRRLVGLVAAAFFVAIFPGNIAQYVEGTSAFGLDTDGARLARLFFQPVLVLAALWSCGWLAPRRP